MRRAAIRSMSWLPSFRFGLLMALVVAVGFLPGYVRCQSASVLPYGSALTNQSVPALSSAVYSFSIGASLFVAALNQLGSNASTAPPPTIDGLPLPAAELDNEHLSGSILLWRAAANPAATVQMTLAVGSSSGGLVGSAASATSFFLPFNSSSVAQAGLQSMQSTYYLTVSNPSSASVAFSLLLDVVQLVSVPVITNRSAPLYLEAPIFAPSAASHLLAWELTFDSTVAATASTVLSLFGQSGLCDGDADLYLNIGSPYFGPTYTALTSTPPTAQSAQPGNDAIALSGSSLVAGSVYYVRQYPSSALVPITTAAATGGSLLSSSAGQVEPVAAPKLTVSLTSVQSLLLNNPLLVNTSAAAPPMQYFSLAVSSYTDWTISALSSLGPYQPTGATMYLSPLSANSGAFPLPTDPSTYQQRISDVATLAGALLQLNDTCYSAPCYRTLLILSSAASELVTPDSLLLTASSYQSLGSEVPVISNYGVNSTVSLGAAVVANGFVWFVLDVNSSRLETVQVTATAVGANASSARIALYVLPATQLSSQAQPVADYRPTHYIAQTLVSSGGKSVLSFTQNGSTPVLYSLAVWSAAAAPDQITYVSLTTAAGQYVPPSPGGVIGDPQFTGFLGQSFQFHGIPDEYFNILTSPHAQLNAQFLFLTSQPERLRQGEQRLFRLRSSAQNRLPDTAAWTHDGTYLGQVGIKVQLPVDQSQQRVELTCLATPGRYKLGMESVTLQDTPVDLQDALYPVDLIRLAGLSSPSADVQLVLLSRHVLRVSSPLFTVLLVNSDGFFNLENATLSEQPGAASQLDGLLGQTADEKRYFPAAQRAAAAGTSKKDYSAHQRLDYLVADRDPLSSDYVANRYSPHIPVTSSELGGQSSIELLNMKISLPTSITV